ncbi:unnamed protein product [Rotaria sp. Silwood2]|nr:unnamed protein product [Rotaria sp. Silwood2]
MNTIPLLDDGIVIPQNRNNWRSYNETDIDTMKTRNQFERTKDEYQRSSRYHSRPLSVHTPTNQQYHRSTSPNYRNHNYVNENHEWYRRSPSPTSTYKYS